MNGPEAPGSGWEQLFPTPAQTLLLHAVFGPGAEFTRRWSEWLELTQVAGPGDAGLGRNDARLLPLAAPRLAAHGLSDALAVRARAAFRLTRATNTLFLREMSEVVTLLQGAGVDSLLIKGVSLLLDGYADLGLRPMEDLDIAVRPKQFAEALAALRRQGWTLVDQVGHVDPRMVHAIGLRGPRGTTLDLHCHPIYQSRREGLDDLLWDLALPVSGPGWRALRLAPEHQVLQLIAHGLRWVDPPPIRWAPDVVVAAAGRPLDWSALVAAATRLELTATVGPALAWLDRHGFLAVPPETLSRLNAVKVSRREVRLRRVLSTPPTETLRASLALNIARLGHLAGDGGVAEFLRLIVPFMRTRPGAERQSPLAFATHYITKRRGRGRPARTPPP